MVSLKRHRYNSVTDCRERLCANLVFTEPGLGALAMMTSRRFVGVIETCYPSLEVPYVLQGKLSRRPGNAVFPLAEIVTETPTQPPFGYHQRAVGRLRAKKKSIPHVRPAAPTANASEARTGTSNSHIHAVPHSETHRLARNPKATRATGRVKRPSTSNTPTEISVSP